VTTFRWLPRSRNRPLHPEEVLTTKDRLAQPSSWVPSFFLPCDSLGVGGEFSAQWLHIYFSLLGPYHQHVIGTFNTCSRGPTHRSLTDIGGGYNLGGAGLPHTTPRPSQPAVSTFPYWPCPVSSLTKFHQINQSVECK
jgi:hypothetical protein